jgi:5'-nucleotidase
VLASNMKFDPASAGDDQLEQLAQAQVLRTSMMKTVGGLKVGLFGLMGKDAADVTPTKAPLVFEDIVTAAKRMVMELRAGGADLVIALSHSGIDGTGKGEDEVLARMAPGIDVIVSGHTHDKLEQPVRVGNTVIVTAGSYGRYLGKLDLSVTPPATAGGSPTVAIDGYVLQSIDDQIPGDPATQAAVDQYIAALDGTLMSSGLGYKKVLAETDADLPQKTYEEAPIGNLVTDGYRMVTAQLAQAQMIPPPVISVEGNGQLRTSISKGTTGQIWLADLFRVTPIGIGPDQKPGFPLVTYHLHAGDLASGLELGAAAPLVPDQFFLQVSGLTAEVDMSRPPFGRVVSITLAGETTPLDLKDTTRCFKVVTTNYVAGLLGVVSTQTQGALPPVVAKEADCTTPIADPTTRFVDADPVAPGVQELKQWQAVMKFVTSPAFLDTDGDMIPNIPAAYTMAQGRIVKR